MTYGDGKPLCLPGNGRTNLCNRHGEARGLGSLPELA
jgi:hypothetical protein